MITINRTTPYTPTRKLETKPANRSTSVDELEVDRSTSIPRYDRRKNRDRRHQNKGNGLLETRCGKDRRSGKQSKHPSIDIEA